MKLDLGQARQAYVTPEFGDEAWAPLDPRLDRRLKRPMRIGAIVVAVGVVGMGLWAALTPIDAGINAPAEVRSESARKTLRSREPSNVKQVLVREGQRVAAGQPLLLFNDVEARAAHDVLKNQYDTLIAQTSRFMAEATGKTSLVTPPELAERIADPRVAGLVRDQEFLFATRLSLYQSQAGVMRQRIDQLQSQVAGLQAQVAAVDTQADITEQELSGYVRLNEQGFAPKSMVLRYQGQRAELGGRKGQLMSDIARMRQQMGETRLQLAGLANQRASEAAEGLRDSQARIADVVPRLTAARQALSNTVVKAPADGFVFGLTQFTPGGVVAAGEVLMDVVPSGAPLTVTATIKPEDVDSVRIGQPARVRLTGLNPRFSDDLDAKVTLVSADRILNERTGVATYRVDLAIAPAELRKLKRGAQLRPGMPATAIIVTGQRTVLDYLVQPLADTLKDAFREE
jgi:HlyD family type I secretion membrane fusion protein